MTWNYDDSLPTDKDMVRALIGDTDTTNQLVSDEFITAMLVTFPNTYNCAAAICDGLATKYARTSSISIDGLTVSGADRARMFRDLAANLRAQASQAASGGLGVPVLTGVSISEMDSVDDDTDRPPSRIKVGQDDFDGTPEDQLTDQE